MTSIVLPIIGILIVCALFGAVWTPFDPLKINFAARLQPPGPVYWLGTDEFGRDILARMAHGARTTLTVGASVALGAGLCGLVLGLVAGYYRRLDSLLMRIADGLMAFPSIVLALGLVAAFGPRVSNLVAALAIVYTPRVARLVRGTVLTLNGQEFVTAARALGASDNRIILNHLLRNLMNVLIVQVTYVFALAIVAESALSFLGVSDSPDQPTWGSILSAGR